MSPARWSLLLVPMAATWWAWAWLCGHLVATPDGALGLIPLSLAVALMVRRWNPNDEPGTATFVGAAALLIVALATCLVAPKLVAIAAAVLAVSWCAQMALCGRFSVAVDGLFLFSLPLMDAVQFYLGYPLRAVAAHASTLLLGLSGEWVELAGTTMIANGVAVAVDVPCAGLSMFWLGAVTACALAGWRGLDTRRTALLLSCAAAGLMLVNALRVAALFHATRLGVGSNPIVHELAGAIPFALMVGCLAAFTARLSVERTP